MYKRILVPYDGSPPSRAALREAIDMAFDSGSTLVILNVVSELPLLMGSGAYVNYGDLAGILMKTGEDLVKEAVGIAEKDGVTCESKVVDAGAMPVCDAILDQIAALQCDLVVMGTHGRRGLKRLTLGSDAELVVRRTTVPVMLAKAVEAPSKTTA